MRERAAGRLKGFGQRHAENVGSERRDRIEHPLERAGRDQHVNLAPGESFGQRKQRRDRSRLQQVEPAGHLSPFDVLWRIEQCGDAPAQSRQLEHGRFRQRGASCCVFLRFERASLNAWPNRQRLGAHPPLEHAPRRHIDDVAIGLHAARNQGLAQSKRRLDHCLRPLARQRVRGEQHARHVARDHLLDDHGERSLLMWDAMPSAVADRARSPQAAPALHHGAQEGGVADHVEDRVLLSGERQVRQVLGGGRGTHGDRGPTEGGVGVTNGFDQRWRHHGGREPSPDRRRGRVERRSIFARRDPRGVDDPLLHSVCRDMVAVHLRRDYESRRDAKPCAREACEIRALTAANLE